MAKNKNCLGYIKYNGNLVDEGVFDAKKSAQALIGFDDAVRFFATCQNSKLSTIDFELPVKIKQGSWEVLIPDAILWLKGTASLAGTAYIAKAAYKMAENDFENIGIKSIFKTSLEAIQWVIRIGKHIGDISVKQFENVKFRKKNTEIGISNSKKETLWVPKYYLELYSKCPKSLLHKLASLVEEERVFSIVVNHGDNEVIETISTKYKPLFITPEEPDILFPELVHGMNVVLVGEVTRGNETTNTMGFRYNEHILTAKPKNGSIVNHKDSLFLEAEIHGTIDRTDEKGIVKAKKPKIIFSKIVSTNPSQRELPLFKNNT